MHDNYCLAIIISGNSIPETVSKRHKLSPIFKAAFAITQNQNKGRASNIDL